MTDLDLIHSIYILSHCGNSKLVYEQECMMTLFFSAKGRGYKMMSCALVMSY